MSLHDKLVDAAESLFVATHPAVLEKLKGIEGPTPTFPAGTLLDFVGKKPWDVLLGYAETHGAMVLLWALGDPVIVPTAPALTEAVLVSRVGDFYKKSPVRALTPLLTEVEPFLANLPEWQRIVAASLFRLPGFDAWVAAQAPVLADSARHAFSALPEGQTHDALQAVRRAAFDAFSHMAVGRALDDDAWERFQRMAAEGDERMSAPVLLSEESFDLGFRVARSGFWRVFLDAIADARAHDDPARVDALAFALRAGTTLSDDQLAAALANLYFSGLFSSSSALLSALYHLTEDRPLRDALAAELRAAVTGGFTAEALASVPTLERVIRESLRLHPPVPIYMRNSAADREVELGGHLLPPDTTIYLSNYAVHRNSAYWSDPHTFLPSRWDAATLAANPYGSGRFWPFGRGPRACIGQEVALVFLRATLAVAALEHALEVGKGQPYEGKAFFACMSAEGLGLTVRT